MPGQCPVVSLPAQSAGATNWHDLSGTHRVGWSVFACLRYCPDEDIEASQGSRMIGNGFAGMCALYRLGLAVLLMAPASGLFAGVAAPVVELELRTPATVDSHGGGLGNDGNIIVKLTLVEGASAQGPFTIRTTLPSGITYVGNNDPTQSQWTCSLVAQDLACTSSTGLPTQGQYEMGIRLDLMTDGSLPVPGDTSFRVTMESAELPLPPAPDCTTTIVNSSFATSRSGCVERVVPNRRSELAVASWDHSPTAFLAGGRHIFKAVFHNVGFGYDNTPVTASVQLPPGFSYVSAGGLVSWGCSAQTPDAQGQRVDCTTGYFYDGMPDADTRLTLQIDVDPGIDIPGPHPISATISNPQQPAPDMALCDDVSPPLGCGYYEIPTAAPPQSRMDIVATAHSPAEFPRGAYGVLTLTVANIGDANAGAGDLKLLLPPGVAYDSINYSAIPGASCSTTGAVATGQTMNCVFASGLPNTGSYEMAFRLIADSSAQSLARVVMAIGDTNSPGPGLVACSGDPDAIGCAEHFLDLSAWLFCDGFEDIPRICGQPQLFP